LYEAHVHQCCPPCESGDSDSVDNTGSLISQGSGPLDRRGPNAATRTLVSWDSFSHKLWQRSLAILIFAVGCASTGQLPTHTTSTIPPSDQNPSTLPMTTADSAARALGMYLRVRFPHGFVIYPKFETPPAVTSWVGPLTLSPEAQFRLLDQIRRGAQAQWADTLMLTDISLRDAAPDSSRTIVALSGPLLVAGDTAKAAIMLEYVGKANTEPPPFTVAWYTVARSASGWRAAKHTLLYAT
jgi:hypothetical protein